MVSGRRRAENFEASILLAPKAPKHKFGCQPQTLEGEEVGECTGQASKAVIRSPESPGGALRRGLHELDRGPVLVLGSKGPFIASITPRPRACGGTGPCSCGCPARRWASGREPGPGIALRPGAWPCRAFKVRVEGSPHSAIHGAFLGGRGGGACACACACVWLRMCATGVVAFRAKQRGFVTPTETNVHGDALRFMGKTWARHKTTETVLNNGWRLAAVGGGWRLVVPGGDPSQEKTGFFSARQVRNAMQCNAAERALRCRAALVMDGQDPPPPPPPRTVMPQRLDAGEGLSCVRRPAPRKAKRSQIKWRAVGPLVEAASRTPIGPGP